MLRSVVRQHFFLCERIVIFTYVVQVQAVRVVAWKVLEERVAILGRSEARAQNPPIQRRPINVLNAFHRVRLLVKRHVSATSVLGVPSGVRRAALFIDGNLQFKNVAILAEKLTLPQHLLLAATRAETDHVHEIPLNNPHILQMFSRSARASCRTNRALCPVCSNGSRPDPFPVPLLRPLRRELFLRRRVERYRILVVLCSTRRALPFCVIFTREFHQLMPTPRADLIPAPTRTKRSIRGVHLVATQRA